MCPLREAIQSDLNIFGIGSFWGGDYRDSSASASSRIDMLMIPLLFCVEMKTESLVECSALTCGCGL